MRMESEVSPTCHNFEGHANGLKPRNEAQKIALVLGNQDGKKAQGGGGSIQGFNLAQIALDWFVSSSTLDPISKAPLNDPMSGVVGYQKPKTN